MATEGAARPRLVTPALVWLCVLSFGAMAGFALLLSVVPLYATTGGAGGIGAGMTTGALLLSTVGIELATPRLAARFGYRPLLAAGLLLLGAPTLVLPASTGLAAIVTVSAIRGMGFGIVVVVGSALVAALVPAQRRGEGLGLHGLVIGVAAVGGLPLGVYLAGQIGYTPVFVAAAIAVLAVLPAVRGLPAGAAATAAAAATAPLGMVAGLRTGMLLRPSIVFSTMAVGAGVVVTFLPLALPAGSSNLAAIGLLAHAVTAVIARWWAGRYGDRHEPERLIIPALLTAAAGMLTLLLIASPVAVMVGMLLFGAGFGASQNASLALMFSRVAPPAYGTVSAVWNLAYDGGMGLGAVGFGLLVAQVGYPAGFAVTGALMVVALLPAWRDRHVTG
jgi:predicted MFS family arabinose efflux permease